MRTRVGSNQNSLRSLGRLSLALVLALVVCAAAAACQGGGAGVDAAGLDTGGDPPPITTADLPPGPPADGGVGDGPGSDALPADGGGDGPAGDLAAASCVEVDPASCPTGGDRPSRRSEHAGVYDPLAQRLVIHGGSDAVPRNCDFPTPTFLDEVWAYYEQCGTWKQLAMGTGAGPGPRARHMAAYDPRGKRMLVFGGRFRSGASGSYTLYNDTWALDLSADGSEAWSEVSTQSPPPARVNGVFVVNADGTTAYLFGGNQSASGAAYQPLNDVWALDLGTGAWTQLSAGGAQSGIPAPRLFSGGFFDARRNRLVIHGGADETAFSQYPVNYGDLWAFDVSTSQWEQLHDGAGTAPQGRFWGALVSSPDGSRYLSFGGHDGTALGNTNDTWAFDAEARSWTALREGDSYNAPPRGFCDFPADFTNVDADSPERRNAHVLVATPCPAGGGGILTFGGKTDCGAIDDVFRFRLADGTWEELLSAREGESCLRQATHQCSGLCF